MSYYVVVPEVAGRFGQNTVFIDEIARPPHVQKFHYEFDGWLGDPIIETIGCYIITESLRDGIAAVNPTGVRFAEVEISKSDEFMERRPDCVLPPFVWIQITGVAGEDDFGYTTTKGHSLVVSERIKEIIVNSGIVNCELVQLENWTGRRNAILEKIRKFRVTHPPPER